MTYNISIRCLALLISSLALAGCSRPSEVKSQPPVPIASGDLIHCAFTEDAAPEGTNAVFNYTHHTFTEGHVVVYESGIVVLTEPDGTKHCERIGEVTGLSFR
jgi:hypothetical protein